MKLKKVAAICAKQGAFYLFDEVEESGELIRQWLGDGRSAYPLSDLPVLGEENLCAMFDITEKRREEVRPCQEADAGQPGRGGLRQGGAGAL